MDLGSHLMSEAVYQLVCHDFLEMIGHYDLKESDFEITETETYPPLGTVSFLQGTITVKYKESDIAKTYEVYGVTWLPQFEHDLRLDFYRTRRRLAGKSC